MTTKSTITTRSMNSQQTSGPHKKPQLIGIYESSANEFFLGDYSHLLRIPSIIPGTYDPIDEIFYPESPSSDAVVKVNYNLRKYLAHCPLPPPKESSSYQKTSLSSRNTSPNNATQNKIWRFQATLLLVGRLKCLSKITLLQIH